MAGTLFVVATPIGNLEDISARAVRVLREASVIAAEDTRHTGRLLQHFGISTPTTSFHEHSEPGKAGTLLARLRAGDSVALVTDAGTPVVSDPGEPLVRMAHEAGIRVEPIPGPSAVVAALSASGFGSGGFVFLGFPPNKGSARRAWFERLVAARSVVPVAIFYEAPHRIEATLAELARLAGDPRVCVARELTKAHEEILVGRVSELTLAQVRGEFTVVVELGQETEHESVLGEPAPADVANKFSHLTKTDGLTRRQAMASLSRAYGLPARRIFDLLEQAKISPV